MRLVFWGTPEFALPSLRALLEHGEDVAAVVTQPDRPAGRGRRVQAPPVKVEAARAGLRVLQPETPRGPEFIRQLASLEPELSVVAAYGEILRPEVLELPARGSINVHASLLPELRGAAPVNWAIIRGLPETGVTIMRMVQELDAGPILHQVRHPLDADTTAGELSDALAELGARALIETLERMRAGRVVEREQDDTHATYAPKLTTDDARLDWSQPAETIERWIRGCDPYPAAWSMLEDLRVRLFRPTVIPEDRTPDGSSPGGESEGGAAVPEPAVPEPAEPGRVLRADPRDGLIVQTGTGRLRIDEVQPAGKRRMNTEEWIRGRGAEAGHRFR